MVSIVAPILTALGQGGPSLNTQQLFRVLLLAALGYIVFESPKK